MKNLRLRSLESPFFVRARATTPRYPDVVAEFQIAMKSPVPSGEVSR
jgi:hypothetical protein